MKTTIFKTTLLLLLALNLTACDSCNKKTDSTVPAYSTTDYKEVDTTNLAETEAAADPEVGTAVQTKTPKSQTVKGKAKTDDQSGYSAADGTDAENHDGDQYTRNDDKPMPSGPPIK